MSIYFIYAVNLINGIGVFAAQMVLSLYALHQGASPLAVGVLAATFSIFPMSLAVTAGKLIDRYGSRWPMTLGSLGSALGLLVPVFVPGMPALFIAGTLTGLAIVFVNLAVQNLVGLLSTPDTRARDFSNFTLTMSAASFLGPLAGGFSIDHFSYTTTCLLLSLLGTVPVLMLIAKGAALPGGTRHAARASGGIRAMLTDPAVRHTLMTGMLINAGLNLYQVYMPVYAHSIGLPASTIGMILAMNSTAAFFTRFMLPHLIRRVGEHRLLAYAFFMGAAGLTLIPVIHIPLLLALISFVFGLGMGCGQPIVTMLMFATSRDGRSGEALGLKIATNQLIKLIGPVLFGSIGTALGLMPMFWINAGLLAVGGVLSQGHSRARR